MYLEKMKGGTKMKPYEMKLDDARKELSKIRSIDLRITQGARDYACYQRAFCEDLIKGKIIPYDHYKIVRNCETVFTNDFGILTPARRLAIVFYRQRIPIRLLVGSKDNNLDQAMKTVFETTVKGRTMRDWLKSELHLHPESVNLGQEGETNESEMANIASCHTWSSLQEAIMDFTGNNPEISWLIKKGHFTLRLKTDTEFFNIQHEVALYPKIDRRKKSKEPKSVILIQTHSPLTDS